MKPVATQRIAAWPCALLVFCVVFDNVAVEATALRKPSGQKIGLLRAHAHRREAEGAVHKLRRNASDFDPQLTAAVDKLGGILDAVSSSFTTVREALTSFDQVCGTQASGSGARAAAGNSALSTLEDTKLRETATEARLAAQLAGLRTDEEKAKANFDSTVERRALERSEYLTFKDTNDKQTAVLGEVIKKLEAKKLEIGSLSNTSSHQSDPGSGSAQLDYVIGVFSSLLDSTQQEGSEEAADAETTDAQLLTLVNNCKETLQHTDAQAQTKETERVAAEVAVLRAQQEITLRKDIEDKETTIGEKLTTLCASGSGKVPVLLSRGDQRLSDLDTHINLALTTLSELGFPGAFLQRRATPQASGEAHRSAATLATKQAADAARGLPAAALAAAEKIVPQVQLAILKADPASEGESALSADQQQCVTEKKRLTAEIVTARQAALQARTAHAQAQGRVETRGGLITIVEEEKNAVDATKTALEESWTPVTQSVSGGTEAFDAVVADATTELAGVQTDVNGYAAEADAPPKAQALKVAIEACVKSLKEVQDVGLVSVPDAAGSNSEAQVTLAAISEQLTAKGQELQDAQAPDETEATTQQANAEAFAAQEQELMQQRTQEEERCEAVLKGTSEGGGASLLLKKKVVVSKSQEADAWSLAKKWLGRDCPEAPGQAAPRRGK